MSSENAKKVVIQECCLNYSHSQRTVKEGQHYYPYCSSFPDANETWFCWACYLAVFTFWIQYVCCKFLFSSATNKELINFQTLPIFQRKETKVMDPFLRSNQLIPSIQKNLQMDKFQWTAGLELFLFLLTSNLSYFDCYIWLCILLNELFRFWC